MKRKILVMFLSIAIILTGISFPKANVKAASTGKVTLVIEKLTIGQGVVCQPVQLNIYSGDTIKTVISRYFMSISGQCAFENSQGSYLYAINNADKTRKAYIPDIIANGTEIYQYEYVGDDNKSHVAKIDIPSTNDNIGNNDNILGNGDYSVLSGWIYTINNKPCFSGKTFNRTDCNPNTDPTVNNIYKPYDGIYVKNGDVIRVMFSIYGFGADLGIDTYDYTGVSAVPLEDKTELLRTVGDVNSKKSYWIKYPNVKIALDYAIKVVNTYNPSRAYIKTATDNLKNAIRSPKNPPVGSVALKSAKNIKGGKIKIIVNKVSGVTGYQYKYGNNKKLRNKKKRKLVATTKRLRKITFTTKSINNIKKNKAYVKVRAYLIVNGKYVYGKWTKVKTVKMKK